MNDEQRALVEANMNLVYHIIHRDYPTFSKDEDLIQSAMVGLCNAAEKWDEERGLFSTYAGRCIRNEINKEFISRKPYSKTISLQTTTTEGITLEDQIMGDDDIVVMDEAFYDTLNDDELTVFELSSVGYEADEIALRTKFTLPKVNKLLRITKLKWEKFNEN